MPKKVRVYQWFLYPKNDATNEAISMCCPGETTEEKKCSDGVSRPMWRVTKSVRDALRNSVNQNMSFDIYCSEGIGPTERIRKPPNFIFKK